MKKRRIMFMAASVFAVVGFASLDVSLPELGCGGTEFRAAATECPKAVFEMTMDEVDLEPVERQMCLRTLKVESACAVYEYNLVGLGEEVPDSAERGAEHLQIVHGRGCEAVRVEGRVMATIETEPVEIAMVGTPTRAPIPVTDTEEPLAIGTCSSADWKVGEFELAVTPASAEEP